MLKTMPKPNQTRELVFKAADELLEKGIRPTQQNVRDCIGSGSLTTINKALGAWWESLSQRMHRQNEHPELPEPVVRLAAQTWDRALAYSEQQYHQHLTQYVDKINELEEKIKTSTFEDSHQYAELQRSQQRLLEQHSALLNELQSSQKQAQKLEEKLFRTQILLNDKEKALERKASTRDSKNEDQLIEYKVKIRIQEEEIERSKRQIDTLQSENAMLRKRLRDH